MNEKEVVNVTMFGGKSIFGGRETRKEVVVSSCPFTNTCEALNNGRCAAHNPRVQNCENMDNELVVGFTSRAQKHGQFVRKWKDHEKYGAVEGYLKRFEYVGDGQLRIDLPHINIENALIGYNGYSSTEGKVHYMNRVEFNVEALKKIMESYSQAMFGGINDNKKEKEEMLLTIKEVDRDLYDEYMKLTGSEINYVGKTAYLVTLKPNTKIKDGWFWDGEKLSKESRNGVDCRATRGFTYGNEISFKPEKDSLVEVECNSWVDDNTKFDI